MMLTMFTVYDHKAGAYMAPFFFRSKGEAIRAFSNSCDDVDHLFNKHPDDFSLFAVGQFSDTEGRVEAFLAPEPIGSARDFKRQQQVPIDLPASRPASGNGEDASHA